MKPKKKKRERLNDIQKWRIEKLVPMMFGMAHITSVALGTDVPSKADIARVSRYARQACGGVMPHRRGETPWALHLTRTALRIKRLPRRKSA